MFDVPEIFLAPRRAFPSIHRMSSIESSAPPKRRGLAIAALAVAFAAAFALFMQDNRFPYFYHPDEWGKARQLVDGTKSLNFNHPLLLLNVAKPLKRLWGRSAGVERPVKMQNAVEAGRTASALFAAIAVCALAIAGYVLGGPLAGIAAALVTATSPLLFEHAHIFKEDAALTMGLALVVMVAALVWKNGARPGLAALLGVCAGLAISAKYVGAFSLFVALPVAICAPGGARGRRIGIFAAALCVTLIVANHQMFTHLGEWRKSFDREVGYSLEGHRGLVAQDSVRYYRDWFWKTVPMTAVVFLGINALNLVTTARRRSLAEWLIFALPFGFTAMLMSSPKISDRYFLPAAVLFHFNALVGVGLAAEWFTRAFGKWRVAGQCAFALVVLLIGWSGHFGKFQTARVQFKSDDRRELEEYLSARAPAGAIIAQDSAVGLPDPEHHKQKGMKREFAHEVLGSEFAPDLGSLEELRAKGVRYVVVTPKKYQRYTGGSMAPGEDPKVREDFARRKAFYTALPQQAKLLKKWPIAEIDTLHPGLELYDLNEKP
jgi:hypothetical protein